MRITRIKLCNFIGIKHGLDRNEVEINFQKDNKITMFLGGNGSGKTTILSALTPFKDSQDDRKQLILDGCEGRKEIDIEYNGHVYNIIHIYAKTSQSFIKKDGVELNENGGVRTFEDIAKRELDVTKDYFSIGRIGSNTKNFIDFTTMERKQYIGNFLNIDDILAGYKTVNEKIKNYKKEMAVIAKDLQNYKNSEVLETEIKEKTEHLQKCKEELTESWQLQGKIDANITETKNALLNQPTSETLKSTINRKAYELEAKQKNKAKYETELPDYNNSEIRQSELQQEINELNTRLSVNNSERTNETLLITDAQNKVSALKIKISSLGKPEDAQKIDEELEAANVKLSSMYDIFNKSENNNFVKENYNSNKSFPREIEQFRNFMSYIEKYFKELSSYSINASEPNIHHFLLPDFGEDFQRQIYHSRKVVEEKQKLLDAKQDERNIKNSHISQLKNLEIRPSECKIDTCPFIKEALSYKNIYSEIEACDNEIQQIKRDLDVLKTEADNLQELERLGKEFKNEYNKVEPKINAVYLNFIKDHKLEEYISGSMQDFLVLVHDYINDIENMFEHLGKMIQLQGTIKQLERSKTAYDAGNTEMRVKLEEDLNDVEEKLKEYKIKLESLTSTGKELSNELTTKSTLNNKYSEYIEIIKTLKPLEDEIIDLKEKFNIISSQEEKYNTLATQLETQKIIIQTQQNNEKQLTSELNNLNIALAAVTKLREKAETLNTEYKPVETVATALSPTGGIPLIFIKNYLEETEAIANSLLELAFGKDFQIRFSTTEKEFAIQVVAKNNIKPDIKMASQGEVAIATISISLALIEQKIGNYNILCLDEIDGPLDYENRGNFINILNTQIEKLGIEQVFIISHNDAFDTAEMDLVLLKGNNVNKENSSFMKNKNIIFEV